MGAHVIDLLHIPDGVSDDPEIYVLYEIKPAIKNGTSKLEAIAVEDYACRPKKTVYFDGEVELLSSLPRNRKRVCRGESSNSKTAVDSQFDDGPLTFLCEICVDEKPRNQLFRELGCQHRYCSDCIAKYVSARLQDNITAVNCPMSGCFGVLEPQFCGSVLPRDVFDRWSDALCEAVILGVHKFYCPYKDCSALLVDDRNGASGVIVESVCPHCNRMFCADCKVPWHNGVACSEFQSLRNNEMSNEDMMFMNLANKEKWKRCRKCRFFVEKESGCLFMRCRCGHTFCYNCGAPLTDHYCRNCKR